MTAAGPTSQSFHGREPCRRNKRYALAAGVPMGVILADTLKQVRVRVAGDADA